MILPSRQRAAERAERTSRRGRGGAESRGEKCHGQHAGGARCARHRSRGGTETQTQKHAEAVCVSVLLAYTGVKPAAFSTSGRSR